MKTSLKNIKKEIVHSNEYKNWLNERNEKSLMKLELLVEKINDSMPEVTNKWIDLKSFNDLMARVYIDTDGTTMTEVFSCEDWHNCIKNINSDENQIYPNPLYTFKVPTKNTNKSGIKLDTLNSITSIENAITEKIIKINEKPDYQSQQLTNLLKAFNLKH